MGQEYKIDFQELKYDFLLARVNVRKEYLKKSSIYLPFGYILYWFDGVGDGRIDPQGNSCIENIFDTVDHEQKSHDKPKNIELCCVRKEFEVTVPFGFRHSDRWLISGSVKCELDTEALLYAFLPKSWRLLSMDGLNFEILSEYYIDPNDEIRPQKGVSVELREVVVSTLEDGMKDLKNEKVQQQELEEKIRSLLDRKSSLPKAIKKCALIGVHVKEKEEGAND